MKQCHEQLVYLHWNLLLSILWLKWQFPITETLLQCNILSKKRKKSEIILFKKKVKSQSPWTITNKTPFILNMFCTLRFSNHQRNIRNSDFIFAANKRTHHFLAVKKIINVCYLSMLCNNVNRFPKYLSPIRTTLDKKDWSGSEITNSSV